MEQTTVSIYHLAQKSDGNNINKRSTVPETIPERTIVEHNIVNGLHDSINKPFDSLPNESDHNPPLCCFE